MKKKQARGQWEWVKSEDPDGILSSFTCIGGIRYVIDGQVQLTDDGQNFRFIITGIREQAPNESSCTIVRER